MLYTHVSREDIEKIIENSLKLKLLSNLKNSILVLQNILTEFRLRFLQMSGPYGIRENEIVEIYTSVLLLTDALLLKNCMILNR